MKIAPPANQAERRALQARLEREHGRRVDVLKNRWGWYARFFKKAPRRKPKAPPGQQAAPGCRAADPPPRLV